MEEKPEKNQIIKKNKKEILMNLVIAAIVILYFIILILGKINIAEDIFETDLKVITMMLLAITIIVFEIAYKKDSGKLAITGIEVLVISCHTLSIPYFTEVFKLDFRNYILISLAVFSVYYILKIAIVYTIGKKKYLNSLSDIAEIVKEEPIKKEAVKRNTAEEEITEKEENKPEEKIEKVEKKKTKKAKKEKVVDKEQGELKQEKVEQEKVEPEEEKPKAKKRGRPKKKVEEKE